MKKIDRIKELSKILSEARYSSGISQEDLAAELGVSRKTVQNYESGASFPDIFKMSEWFRICGVNPTLYFLEYFNYGTINNIKASNKDSEIIESLHKAIDCLSPDTCRQLFYLLCGAHGSDPCSVIEMVTADLHCPMLDRISIARTIIDNYEMREQRDELVEPENILPNIERLHSSVEAGKRAAIEGRKSY